MKRVHLATGIVLGLVSAVGADACAEETYAATLLEGARQEMIGIGAYLPDPTWQGPAMKHPERVRLIYKDLGLHVGRVRIRYIYGKPDHTLDTKLIDENLGWQLELCKQHHIRWLITTWSPPVYMKTHNTKSGKAPDGSSNRLKPEYMDGEGYDFADYYVAVLKYLRDERDLGTPIAAVVANEPELAPGYVECFYTGEEIRSLVKQLRRKLDAAGFRDVPVLGPETAGYNTAYSQYFPLAELRKDPDLLKAFQGISVHKYGGGSKEAIDRFVAYLDSPELKDKPRWMTETGHQKTQAPNDLGEAIAKSRALMHHLGHVGFGAWILWTGADLAPGGSSPRPSRFYHVMKRVCASVRPGMHVRRLETDDPDLLADHWQHMDMLAWEGKGAEVVMLVNPTAEARKINVRGLRGKRITVYRTAGADEDMAEVESAPLADGGHAVPLPGHSIVICVADSPAPGGT